jgi:zinc/manganese transport system substrate-binding protein
MVERRRLGLANDDWLVSQQQLAAEMPQICSGARRRGMKPSLVAILLLFSAASWAQPASKPALVVAAENFYGDVAAQVADGNVTVVSILNNPSQDPHLFEASPSTGRLIANAKIVIYNGAGYDAWMAKLLSTSRNAARQVIVAADLVHRSASDNPHVWYDPHTMPAVAKTIASALEAADPSRKSDYESSLQAFLASLEPLTNKIAEMRRRYAGTEVTATEPVFGYMADALGLKMRNERFQLAVMNNTEPRPSDVVAFEQDLKQRNVKALIYNSQTTDAAVRRLLSLARASRVPVVGVTETEPPGVKYQDWMMRQLEALDQALSNSS